MSSIPVPYRAKSSRKNGFEYRLKLHSCDEIIGRIDSSCNAVYRRIGTQLRLDIGFDCSDDKSWRQPSDSDGVALRIRRNLTRRVRKCERHQIDPETAHSSAFDDWRLRSGADNLCQSPRTRLHT